MDACRCPVYQRVALGSTVISIGMISLVLARLLSLLKDKLDSLLPVRDTHTAKRVIYRTLSVTVDRSERLVALFIFAL